MKGKLRIWRRKAKSPQISEADIDSLLIAASREGYDMGYNQGYAAGLRQGIMQGKAAGLNEAKEAAIKALTKGVTNGRQSQQK